MTGGTASIGKKGAHSPYILALIVALLTVVSLALQTATAGEGEQWAVEPGNVLQYSIAGHRNGTAVAGTATANLTVVNMTEGGGSGGGYFYTGLGSWAGGAVASALSSPMSGACLGGDRIDTIYGAKAVTKYIWHRGASGSEAQALIITYAGVDSKVICRINASGPGFFFSLDLRNGTLNDPTDLDARTAVDASHTFMVPDTMDFSSAIAAGITNVGYGHLPNVAHLYHSMESDGALFYFVTEENIERMEHGGVLESDPTMPLLNGNGSHSALLEGGPYLVVMDAGEAVGGTEQRYEPILRS